ncbi:translation initiation factor IF-2, partial [Planctomycetota bacterium]
LTVNQLAEELDLPIDDVVKKAASIDPDVTAPDSTIDDDVEQYLRDVYKEFLKGRRAREREAKKQERARLKALKEAEKARKKAEREAKKLAKEEAKIEKAKKRAVKTVPGEATEEPGKVLVEMEPSTTADEKQAIETTDGDGTQPATEVAMASDGANAKLIPEKTGKKKPKKEPKVTVVDDLKELRRPVFVRRAPKEPEKPVTPEKQEAPPKKGKDKKAAKLVGVPNLPVEAPKTGSETFKIKRDLDFKEDRRRPGRRAASLRRSATDDARSPRGLRRRTRRVTTTVRSEKEILEELAGKTFEIQLPITIKGLSTRLGLKSAVIQKVLLNQGVIVTLNDPLPQEMVETVGLELSVLFEVAKMVEKEDVLDFEKIEDDAKDLKLRPPIVTILGHVDHGKTTLLDFIRESNVVKTESGGITQHVGAYKIRTEQGYEVVFLDTPGHHAFSEMRARGSQVTDIVVLVVAADDGVMPQTEESINHAKAAGVPLVVAINKIDRPNANPDKVMQQMTQYELIPEEWGGDTIFCKISALTGEGIPELLEMLHLQAEVQELKANPDRSAQGTCIEAEITEDRGVVCNALVQNGTLRKGDILLCGSGFGKIKSMFDDADKEIQEAGPSTPVAIVGLNRMPMAGDRIHVLQTLQDARAIAQERLHKVRERDLAERRHVTLENLFSRIEDMAVKEILVVLKADVTGSVEVLKKSLHELATDEVRVKILHSAAGGISESDVVLADASDAIILGFHVGTETKARLLAQERGVDIKTYQVIYELTGEVRAAMEGMLDPERREVITGHVEIRQIFKVSRIGNIAGCFVQDGFIKNLSSIRLLRDNVVIFPRDEEGGKAGARLASLRRLKDDVKEVKEGYECGLRIEGFDDIHVGDIVEAFDIESFKRTL